MLAKIGSPETGCLPLRAAATSSFSAVSRSMEAGERPFGSDERLGFSPSPSWTNGPNRPSRMRHLLAALGVVAEDTHARLAAILGRSLALAVGAGHRELSGELAFRIVRAADEGAELAELQRKLAGAAGRDRCAGSSRRPCRGRYAGRAARSANREPALCAGPSSRRWRPRNRARNRAGPASSRSRGWRCGRVALRGRR